MTYLKIYSYTSNSYREEADPINSERWSITAKAYTHTFDPLALCVNAEWEGINGINIVFQEGKPVIIHEGWPIPTLTIQPPYNVGTKPIEMTVNLDDLRNTGEYFIHNEIEVDDGLSKE